MTFVMYTLQPALAFGNARRFNAIGGVQLLNLTYHTSFFLPPAAAI